MSEQSRLRSGWQTPPERHVFTDEQFDQLDRYADRFVFICYLGCGSIAIGLLAIAAYLWADYLSRMVHL